MKKILGTVAFAALMTASAGAFAGTHVLTVGGQSYCATGGLNNVAPNLSGVLNAQGQIVTTPITTGIGDAACNVKADVSVSSLAGGLKPGGSPSATCHPSNAYADCINFQADVSWNSAVWNPAGGGGNPTGEPRIVTAGIAGVSNTGATSQANTGSLVLTLTPQADPTGRAVEYNAYGDTVTVGVSAHP